MLGYVQKGIEEGATLVCGGQRYTEGECAKGYFMRPTIFDNCTPDMTIVREEIFGPVVTIQTFKTEEEAIALANDTDYKMSGIGRELGVHGLEEYQEIKQVNINLTPGPAGWYEH